MNTFYNFRTKIIFIMILIISCSGEKEETSSSNKSPRIKKHTRLTSPAINQEFVLGNEVLFQVSSTKSIDSILVTHDGESTTFLSGSFKWKASQQRTGFQRIGVSVYFDGMKETHFPRIKFLSDTAPDQLSYEVLGTYPHDAESFTQGLFFDGDTLIESTGREGQSKLSKININTGQVYKSIILDGDYFGEGSTMWSDQFIQITWTSQTGFVYDRNFNKTGTFSYSHEGWGIATMGDTLLISDGTEVIHLINPHDFSEFGKLEVYTDKRKVVYLNELEIINGKLYANIWMSNDIISIDPKSGKVLERINMQGLRSRFNAPDADVLNGIAYKESTDQTFVTGKLWPNIFEVKFTPTK